MYAFRHERADCEVDPASGGVTWTCDLNTGKTANVYL
jgi:hypothetical protein